MARVANAAAAIMAVAMMGAAMELQRAEAVNYTVGDSQGWSVPSNGATTYSDWASTISFVAGDILVFNFTTGEDDVAVLIKEDFDVCNTNSPVDELTTGPAVYSLDVGGDYYFTSTFGNGSHCQRGQQLAITVSDPPSTAAGAPSMLPVNPGGLTPPKGSSGVASVAITNSSLICFFFFFTAMSFFISF